MTKISQGGQTILIITGLIWSFIMIWVIIRVLKQHFPSLFRNSRVIPMNRLILESSIRRQFYIQQLLHERTMIELKNKVIIINPDNTMSLGISHSSNRD